MQFEGNWDKGSFVDGQWLMANGDVYQGTFSKGKPDGPGAFNFSASKNTLEGKYEKGKWSSGDYIANKPSPPLMDLNNMSASPTVPAPPKINFNIPRRPGRP